MNSKGQEFLADLFTAVSQEYIRVSVTYQVLAVHLLNNLGVSSGLGRQSDPSNMLINYEFKLPF